MCGEKSVERSGQKATSRYYSFLFLLLFALIFRKTVLDFMFDVI